MAITPISTFREFATNRPHAERVILKNNNQLKAKKATNKLKVVWNKVATEDNNYNIKQMFINSIRQEYGSKIGAIMDRTMSLHGHGDLSSRQIKQALDYADILKQNKKMRHDIYKKSAPKPKYDQENNQWVQRGVIRQVVKVDEQLKNIALEKNNKELHSLLSMSSDFLDSEFMSATQAKLSAASKMIEGGNLRTAKQLLDDCKAEILQELTKKIMSGNEDSKDIQKLNYKVYKGFKTGDLNKIQESLNVLRNKLKEPGSGQDDAPIAFAKLPDQPQIDQNILIAGSDEYGQDPDDISWQPEGKQQQQLHEKLPDQPQIDQYILTAGSDKYGQDLDDGSWQPEGKGDQHKLNEPGSDQNNLTTIGKEDKDGEPETIELNDDIEHALPGKTKQVTIE